MAKYIEKQAAMNKFAEVVAPSNNSDFARVPSWNDAVEIIEGFPPADVRPVVRGRWVKAGGSFVTPGGDPVWECSECGKGRHVYGIEHGTYGADVSDGQWVACPNCGAFMEDKS